MAAYCGRGAGRGGRRWGRGAPGPPRRPAVRRSAWRVGEPGPKDGGQGGRMTGATGHGAAGGGAGEIFPTLEQYVGGTPLVRLQRLGPAEGGSVVLCKLEGNNPAGSVKDRPALNMIARAEAAGRIKPGDNLIEATSGNTGIALAMAAAIRGYRITLIMPENMTEERKASMAAFGADLVLV